MADEHLISLQPGTVIAGRYEVVKCLGAGNMGLVYACRDRQLTGHMVAVKVLFPEVAQDKIAAARFRNEILASYGVSHPNVVRAYEYLKDGDLVAYTMEYVNGGDLADRLGKPGYRLPLSEIVRLLSQMCSGVQAIHDAGIVHRDLKPENILLTKDGLVKIADFGIARLGHGPKLTEHGGVVGTIDYVSPEYILNSQVDWRSDIYAMGILAYEMITGESPFRGDSVYAAMTKRLKCDAPPPSTLRPDCPPELDALVLKAMQRDPEKRYQSAAEMFYDLGGLGFDQGPNSGNYLAISKSSSTSYIGPSVHPAQDIAGRHKAAQAAPLLDVETGAAAPVVRPESEQRRELRARPAARDPMAETCVLGPHSGIPARSEPEQPEPRPRLEQVLAESLEPGDWSRAMMAEPVEIGAGDMDGRRMQRLSELVECVNRSVWLDVVTLVLAVFIGVGVGYGMLRAFFPDLMARQTVQAEHGAAERAR